MSDIDFEELDRAVNSLMGRQVAMTEHASDTASVAAAPQIVQPVQQAQPLQPLANASPVALANDVNSAPKIQTAPSVLEVTGLAATPLISRRGGRFMDVMPPAGGRVAPRPMPSAMPSREIAPLQPLTVDPRATVDSSAAQPSTESIAPLAASIAPETVMIGDLDSHLDQLSTESADIAPISPEQVMTMPMLESADFSVQEVPVAAESVEPAEPGEVVATTETVEPTISSITPPLESPFLEGVSVDKRPLGEPTSNMADLEKQISDAVTEELGIYNSVTSTDPPSVEAKSTEAFPAQPATISEISVSDPTEAEQIVQPSESWAAVTEDVSIPVKPPLAPEFSADILAVESESTSPLATSQVVPTTAPTRQVSGDSIAPQHVAEPAVDNPEPNAIFEAATEGAQPLQHPVKKRSGWMVIVWILLLVVIGVGGGVVAWYFFVK